MKKLLYAALSLFLFVAVSCKAENNADGLSAEAGAQNEMGESKEWQDAKQEMYGKMKELYKDATPEEKAIYRKSLEDQMNNSIALMELKYKEFAKNAKPEEQKAYEDAFQEQKALTEQAYKETIEAMGL